ncbi:putative quinol monooxygenase [Carboxylicivirga linearis]|uniref:Antibiotic biosynthesis monooxygenase n=1 Tax=Carboxylicivirga linearis TaxID=1628157 RepID=A0ABS5K1D6_9BACT|nr:putative quinol monooxygenase [Carboxylicivirga linearis]MBS2100982.1 antibiotic biosynthesis monooxygenase [Carboxylicivirga linearis]
MKKTVVAKLIINEASKNMFLKLAQKMIIHTNKEEGCISYNLYQNSFSEDLEYLFYEEYKNEQALKIHHDSEYLANFFTEVMPLLKAEPVINTF